MKHVLKPGSGLVSERLTLLLWTALLAPGTYAAGAHIHGQGQLDIAVDDGRVELFLTAPLGDLNSGTDGSEEALAARFGAADLFVFANADCALEESSIDVLEVDEDWFEETSAEGGDHHEHEADHDEEAGHHADADHHDDGHHAKADQHHGDDHHDEGDHHEDEAHHVADDEDHSGHKDLALTWVYGCSQDPRSARVTLFDVTQLEKIKVQAVGASGATAATLTAEDRDVELP